jgi:hypothetical protein
MMPEEHQVSNTGDTTEDEDVSLKTYRLSNEAFTLAQEAATNQGEAGARDERARTLNAILENIWPDIQTASAYDPGLTNAWSEARLDLGYVLSGGGPTTSIRLFQYLQGLKTA